jgi:hypothetical protein
MKPKKYLGLLRLLLAVLAVLWGVSQGLAQTRTARPKQDKKAMQSSEVPQANPNKVWIKDPNSVMPMRKMTNAERRKAATRNADRQAVAQHKRNTSSVQGVQR